MQKRWIENEERKEAHKMDASTVNVFSFSVALVDPVRFIAFTCITRNILFCC
jgi:hypothetical protein